MAIGVFRNGDIIHIVDTATGEEAWVAEYGESSYFEGSFRLIRDIYLGQRRSAMDLSEDYLRHHNHQAYRLDA